MLPQLRLTKIFTVPILVGKAIIVGLGITILCSCSGHKTKETEQNVANLPQKEIRDLSYAIKAASSYREDMRRLLNSMEDSLVNTTSERERCLMSINLAKKFRPINTDSSLFYAYSARAIAQTLDEDLQQEASIAVINGLSTAGLFSEAIDMLSRIRPEGLSPSVRISYWIAGRRLYGYMKTYAQGNPVCYNKYNDLYRQYDDSLLLYLPRDSQFLAFLECERMVTEKRYQEAREGLNRLLSSLNQESNLYGMAAFQMAEVWKNLGDENSYASMLAVSALSDVKGCVSEGLALPTLADWLYEKGELGESFSFINFALQEATAGNARMRAVTIAQFLPHIDEAYRDKINASRDELMIYFLLVTILLIVSAVLFVFLYKQVKKTKANAEKLSQTSRRQESYIGNFIGLYARYADRLNNLTRLVSTKLAAGQASELKKLIDSGRFTEQNNVDDIHKIFDSAFLDIYPDFIENINSLLRPEEVITIKSPGSLIPELRIYAFVKLGIEESTRIAQILHYSINTVYAYRNKMRNKAIQRDTFDSDVKNL